MTSVGFGNLCAAMMQLFVGIYAVGLYYMMMDWFGAKAWHLGLTSGLAAAAYMVTAMFAGRIGKHIRRHHLMAGGALMIAGPVGLIPFAWSLWAMLALVLIGAVGQALFWPALEAYLSDGVVPTELRSRIGWFNLSWSTADILGAVLGGSLFGLSKILSDHYGNKMLYGTPCFLAAAAVLVIAVIVMVRMHTKPAEDTVVHEADGNVPKSPGRGGHSWLGVFWTMALVANFGAMALRATMASIFPKFGRDILHYSEFEWGILLGMACLTRTLGFLYWQKRHAWEYRIGYFFWVQALLPLAAVLLIFGNSYWLFLLAFALSGVGMSKTYFASIFYSLDSKESHLDRGGIHEAVLGGGMVLPLVAGALASATGNVRAPYIFMLAVVVAAMATQYVMYRRARANS